MSLFDAFPTSAGSSGSDSAPIDLEGLNIGDLSNPGTPLSSSTSLEPTKSAVRSAFATEDLSTPEYLAWKEKHRAEVEKRLEDSRKAQAKAEADAAEQLKKALAERQKRIEKTKVANRDAEKAFITERDRILKVGNDWERIAALCDPQEPSKGEKDTSRLREILVKLNKGK